MHDRDRKRDQSANAVESAPATVGSSLRDRKLAHARAQRAGRGQVVEPEDDEMSVVAVEERDIQAVRDRLTKKYDMAEERGWLALDRFQSVLRQREAEPALEKGFGEVAKKTATDWFVEHLAEGVKGVFEVAELPLGVAEKTVGLAKEGLDGMTEAGKAGDKLAAVDKIVDETRRAFQAATRAARAAIAAAQPMDLFKVDAASEGEIITAQDVDELVTRLLGMLTEKLCKAPSTTATANECEDMIARDRAGASVEADKAGRRMRE